MIYPEEIDLLDACYETDKKKIIVHALQMNKVRDATDKDTVVDKISQIKALMCNWWAEIGWDEETRVAASKNKGKKKRDGELTKLMTKATNMTDFANLVIGEDDAKAMGLIGEKSSQKQLQVLCRYAFATSTQQLDTLTSMANGDLPAIVLQYSETPQLTEPPPQLEDDDHPKTDDDIKNCNRTAVFYCLNLLRLSCVSALKFEDWKRFMMRRYVHFVQNGGNWVRRSHAGKGQTAWFKFLQKPYAAITNQRCIEIMQYSIKAVGTIRDLLREAVEDAEKVANECIKLYEGVEGTYEQYQKHDAEMKANLEESIADIAKHPGDYAPLPAWHISQWKRDGLPDEMGSKSFFTDEKAKAAYIATFTDPIPHPGATANTTMPPDEGNPITLGPLFDQFREKYPPLFYLIDQVAAGAMDHVINETYPTLPTFADKAKRTLDLIPDLRTELKNICLGYKNRAGDAKKVLV